MNSVYRKNERWEAWRTRVKRPSLEITTAINESGGWSIQILSNDNKRSQVLASWIQSFVVPPWVFSRVMWYEGIDAIMGLYTIDV